MLRHQLERVVDAAAARISQHPYHRAMRDGSLHDAVFQHFFWQDSTYLLPCYGRALARCAALAPEHDHARRLTQLGLMSLENRADQHAKFAIAAKYLDLEQDAPDTSARPPVTPTTLGYTGFLTAASAISLGAGLGALLPSAWLYQRTTDELREHRVPGSRFADWIESIHPGPEYGELVSDFADLVAEVGEHAGASDRAALVDNFRYATWFEWAFLEAAWRLEAAPAGL
jgi:thiaminase/transcriptional activator TenA